MFVGHSSAIYQVASVWEQCSRQRRGGCEDHCPYDNQSKGRQVWMPMRVLGPQASGPS